MKRISIKTKLAFFSSILMVAVAVVLSWYFLTSASNLLHNELRKKGIEIVRNLEITCKEGILTKNLFKELNPLIEATMCDQDMSYVAIVDREGKVLAHSKPEEIGKVYKEALSEKAILSREPICLEETKKIIVLGGCVEIGEEQTLLEKTGELEVEKPGPIGAILIGISLENLYLKMNNILKISLPITIGLIIIGIIFAFLFSARITNPISTLTKISHAISEGDLKKRVEVKTNDEIGELAVTFNQMTENLKKAMDELELEKQSLEQKVHERTQELEETNIKLKTHTEELEAVNKELDSFTYSASHDLKEPLRGIQSFSQFILEDYADKLDDTGKDYLKRLCALANRMKSLIDNLLALSRISRIKNPYTCVDANKLVQEILKPLKPIIEEKNVKIEIDDELPFIFCDEVKIKQVFHNLISNAINYNDKKQTEIEIGIEERLVDGISQSVFFVKDNGIGIEEKYFEEIFGIFKRLHQGDAYGGGTGAGLAIVKRVITDHGGNVWVKSKSGEGSTFYFSLPKRGENKEG
ncbi:MAG: ATP-binding protein [bacterium]|nr:ATP-binding protein [bacterium]